MSLSDYASIATIVGTVFGVGALVLAIAEYFTRKHQKEEDERPYVAVSIEPSEASKQLFNVVIKNIGKSSAKNVKIRFSPNQKMRTGSGGKGINSLNIMKNISFLSPGKKVEFFFGSYLEDEGTSIKRKYTINLNYYAVNGKFYSDTIMADPREYEGAMYIDTKSTHDGVKTLTKIQDSLSKQANSLEKINSTLTEKGIRIRNLQKKTEPVAQVQELVRLYENHSENELWLNPFVYDFLLATKQARDTLLSIRQPNEKEKAMLEILNDIVSIDSSKWFYSEDRISELFAKLKELTGS